jgi:hypothetical protein
MPVVRVRVEIREIGRADAALQEAHGSQALQVRDLREELRSVRPLGASHEAAHAEADQVTPTNALIRPTTPYLVFIFVLPKRGWRRKDVGRARPRVGRLISIAPPQ